MRSIGAVAAAALGWCAEAGAFTGGGEGHEGITTEALPQLRPSLVDEAVYWNNEQDSGDPEDDYQRHFDRCRFVEGFAYINQQIRVAGDGLDPSDPDPFETAKQLGRMLHGVQDFYSHANWVGLIEQTHGPGGLWDPQNLYERSDRYWGWGTTLGVVRDDILLGERHLDAHSDACYKPPLALPAGWTATQAYTSTIPQVVDASGGAWRALITHWGDDAACLDVRPDEVVFTGGQWNVIPHRLTHGDGDGCEPEHVALNKDSASRPHWADAYRLARWQSSQAWCQILGVARDTYGIAAVGAAMTLMTEPGVHPHMPETTCGPPSAPGAREVRVTLDGMGAPLPSTTAAIRTYQLALYTDDLDQSRSVRFDVPASAQTVTTTGISLSLCVDPGEALGLSLFGYDDLGSYGLDGEDHPMPGPTYAFSADGAPLTAQAFGTPSWNTSMRVTVRYDVTDVDADGWSTCEEAAFGASDLDPDVDRDGLADGIEDKFGGDPFDPDTDDDGVLDGDEVDAGTDPADADTDDDGVDDGDEVWCGTDPLSPWTAGNLLSDADQCTLFDTVDGGDADADGVTDRLEAGWGLVVDRFDSDGDSAGDGKDPSWLADRVYALDAAELAVPRGTTDAGHRDALAALAGSAEARLAKGDVDGGLADLVALSAGLADCVIGAPTGTDAGCDAVRTVWANVAGVGAVTDGADRDGDGLFDADEPAWGIDPGVRDADADTRPDGSDPTWLVDAVTKVGDKALASVDDQVTLAKLADDALEAGDVDGARAYLEKLAQGYVDCVPGAPRSGSSTGCDAINAVWTNLGSARPL